MMTVVFLYETLAHWAIEIGWFIAFNTLRIYVCVAEHFWDAYYRIVK